MHLVWDVKFDFCGVRRNFNHFTFATRNLPTKLKQLREVIHRLLRRNAAPQMAPLQPNWELLLPVCTGEINIPIVRNHLSAIFVQIKNRQLSGSRGRLGSRRPTAGRS